MPFGGADLSKPSEFRDRMILRPPTGINLWRPAIAAATPNGLAVGSQVPWIDQILLWERT